MPYILFHGPISWPLSQPYLDHKVLEDPHAGYYTPIWGDEGPEVLFKADYIISGI